MSIADGVIAAGRKAGIEIHPKVAAGSAAGGIVEIVQTAVAVAGWGQLPGWAAGLLSLVAAILGGYLKPAK